MSTRVLCQDILTADLGVERTLELGGLGDVLVGTWTMDPGLEQDMEVDETIRKVYVAR